MQQNAVIQPGQRAVLKAPKQWWGDVIPAGTHVEVVSTHVKAGHPWATIRPVAGPFCREDMIVHRDFLDISWEPQPTAANDASGTTGHRVDQPGLRGHSVGDAWPFSIVRIGEKYHAMHVQLGIYDPLPHVNAAQAEAHALHKKRRSANGTQRVWLAWAPLFA